MGGAFLFVKIVEIKESIFNGKKESSIMLEYECNNGQKDYSIISVNYFNEVYELAATKNDLEELVKRLEL